jgi:hypothetical protein
VAIGAGATPAGGGDVFPNDGRTMLRFTNSNGSVRNVTITPPNALSDPFRLQKTLTFQIPATTGDFLTTRIDPGIYNDISGNCSLTYDAVTGLTVWVISQGGA